MQFITSSHSPFVAQAADAGGLYRLSTPGSGEPSLRVPEEQRRRLVTLTPDGILRGEPFRMEHTRSPEAVASRREYSRLAAREAAGLTLEERARMQQLSPFVDEA